MSSPVCTKKRRHFESTDERAIPTTQALNKQAPAGLRWSVQSTIPRSTTEYYETSQQAGEVHGEQAAAIVGARDTETWKWLVMQATAVGEPRVAELVKEAYLAFEPWKG